MTNEPLVIETRDTSLGYFKFEWRLANITFEFDGMERDRNDYRGLLTVTAKRSDMAPHLAWGSFNIVPVSTRKQWANLLAERAANEEELGKDWWTMALETVCLRVHNAMRQGEPIVAVGDSVDIGERQDVEETSYQLWPLMPQGKPTLIYGQGGTAKTWLADLIALQVQYEHEILGWRPTYTKVLYLDYEDTAAEHQRRIRRLKAGLKIPHSIYVTIDYKPLSLPLTEHVNELRKAVLDQSYGLIVVDSAALACGDEPEKAQPVLRMFNALRTLKATILLIGHTPKRDDDKKIRSPYGSPFWTNSVRSQWEVRRSPESSPNSISLGLYHRKANAGILFPGQAVQFLFDDDIRTTSVRRIDPMGVPGLDEAMPVSRQLLWLLKEGEMSAEDLQKAIPDRSAGYIKKTLSLLKKEGKIVNLRYGHWGLAYQELGITQNVT